MNRHGPDQWGESPTTLLAIAVAARRAGDRELEREMRYKLKTDFGIRLVFTRDAEPRKGVANAK